MWAIHQQRPRWCLWIGQLCFWVLTQWFCRIRQTVRLLVLSPASELRILSGALVFGAGILEGLPRFGVVELVMAPNCKLAVWSGFRMTIRLGGSCPGSDRTRTQSWTLLYTSPYQSQLAKGRSTLWTEAGKVRLLNGMEWWKIVGMVFWIDIYELVLQHSQT